MTREEARKLIGGYATGSLTESERAALFHAALDDQDLFDELAGEHSLKELLESPGAKDRLIAALTPQVVQPRRAWWPWAVAFAGGLTVVTVLMLRPREVEAPVQLAEARIEKVEQPIPAPAPTPAAVPNPQVKAIARKAAPPKQEPQPNPAEEAPVADRADVATAGAPMAPPATLPNTAVVQVPSVQALRETVGNGFVAQPNEALLAQRTFARSLEYEITPERELRITPTQPGVLEVTVGPTILFARNPVTANTTIKLEIPENVASVRIEFTPDRGTPVVLIPSVPQ